MKPISDFFFGLLTDAGKRIGYSVHHMSLTQWAIFAGAVLGLAMLMLRTRR